MSTTSRKAVSNSAVASPCNGPDIEALTALQDMDAKVTTLEADGGNSEELLDSSGIFTNFDQLFHLQKPIFQMTVETRISVTSDGNGNIAGYDPSDDDSTHQVSHVGGNNTGVVLGAQVDYDHDACQCNPDALQ